MKGKPGRFWRVMEDEFLAFSQKAKATVSVVA